MKLILFGIFFAVACNGLPLRLINDDFIEREYVRFPEYFDRIFKEIPEGLEHPETKYVINPLYREFFNEYLHSMDPTIMSREGEILKNERELAGVVQPDYTKYVWKPFWFYKLVVEPVTEVPKTDVLLQKLPYLEPSIFVKPGEKVVVGVDKPQVPLLGTVVIPEIVANLKPVAPVVKPEVEKPTVVVNPTLETGHVVATEHNESSKASSSNQSSSESHSDSKLITN